MTHLLAIILTLLGPVCDHYVERIVVILGGPLLAEGAVEFLDEPCGGGFCCSLCGTGDMGCSGCKAEPAAGCNGEAAFDCPIGSCYNGEGACGNPGDPWTAGCCS